MCQECRQDYVIGQICSKTAPSERCFAFNLLTVLVNRHSVRSVIFFLYTIYLVYTRRDIYIL